MSAVPAVDAPAVPYHGAADSGPVPGEPAPPAASVPGPAPEAGYGALVVAVGVLAVIALVAALYLARAFFVPLLIGILASYTLRPVVNWLTKCRIPRAVGAAIVLGALAGSLSWVAFSLRDDAAAVIETLPDSVRKLRQVLGAARTGAPTALQNMQDAATEIQGVAADAGAKPGAPVVAVSTSAPTDWLRDYAIAQSRLVFTVAAQTPIVLLLTYFLLASGEHFRRKLVGFVGPSLARKKDAVRILDEIDEQVQRYLFVMLVSNALLAVATWLAFEALGMKNAGVWGVTAGVLHFIPYVGPMVIALASGMAAFLQFSSPLNAVSVSGVSLLLSGVIGFAFMPWLQSRIAGVNAAILFIALLFFGWLWGIWGLLLGAPLIAIAKVICDRVESLNPIGELLGR